MAVFTLGEASMQALGHVARGASGPVKPALRRPPARSGAPHPTGAPVLRDSIEAGTFEESFFAVPAKGETDRLLRIARRTLDAGRQLRRAARAEARALGKAEALVASLTAAAVRVYEELLTLARLNRGRLFPSYDHLAEATGLGRATVARALKCLEAIGFLVRQRRFRRIEAEGAGPRYKQTSNVYRVALPKSVLAFLPRWMRPAPLPEDQIHREAERVAEVDAMLAGLNCEDLAKATVGGALGKALARIGALVDRRERESQTDTQPLLNSIRSGKYGVGLAGQQHSA